jgi:hypothetical protein
MLAATLEEGMRSSTIVNTPSTGASTTDNHGSNGIAGAGGGAGTSNAAGAVINFERTKLDLLRQQRMDKLRAAAPLSIHAASPCTSKGFDFESPNSDSWIEFVNKVLDTFFLPSHDETNTTPTLSDTTSVAVAAKRNVRRKPGADTNTVHRRTARVAGFSGAAADGLSMVAWSKTLAAAIITMLRSKQMSQQDLAEQLEITGPILSHWMCGRGKGMEGSLICKALGLLIPISISSKELHCSRTPGWCKECHLCQSITCLLGVHNKLTICYDATPF